MLPVFTCILMQHDLRLVVVAAMICATACSAAFGFHLRALQANSSTMRRAWIALTGLVAGSGVWATHFIAMLAYLPGLPIGYDPWITIASLGTAVVGMGLSFAIPALQPGRRVNLVAGALTGVSVAAMHFLGIDALRAQARVDWDVGYVIAAVLVGAVGAALAFDVRWRMRGHARWAAPGALLVLAIVGLHFTAMTALTLVPDPTLATPVGLVGRGVLAFATIALATLVLGAAAALIWMERFGRRATLGGLTDALDAISAGVAFFDPEGRLMSWNRAYETLLAGLGVEVADGVTRDALVDAAIASGWTPGRPTDLVARREERRTIGRSPSLEMRLPDGHWVKHEVFPTRDGGTVTLMTDVTEQREAARALSEARDAAEAANRAKSQFLANMSHEIRTPLNGVLGVADVLAGTALSAQQSELVGVIRTSGALLNSLLTDLLDLARAEAGMAALRPEPVAIADLCASVRSLYAARAEQKGLSLELDLGPEAGARVEADGLRLRQVLGNLVSNAVKFTERGAVTLAVRRDGPLLCFDVRDTGQGFDEALKPTLFGRFQQADDSSTRKHGGAGLGLAICQEYVRLMGGELDCVSRVGEGSTFGFALDLPALAEPEAAPGAAEDRPPGRFRVLIVDDNDVNRQVLGLILDSLGVEHAEAADGREGLEATMTGGFDAVLMDIQMPVMDGFEAIRRIRAWEAAEGRPRLPILIVSANCLQEHVDAGLAAGADGHLSKPVSVAQLLGALEPHAAAAMAA